MAVVFRRADDTICHTRCGRILALQGVRAMLEVDFYCYTCLTHVTLPLAVLDAIPLGPPVGAPTSSEASPR
jgi:hypothetical protein